jgi:hypothetical protein
LGPALVRHSFPTSTVGDPSGHTAAIDLKSGGESRCRKRDKLNWRLEAVVDRDERSGINRPLSNSSSARLNERDCSAGPGLFGVAAGVLLVPACLGRTSSDLKLMSNWS